MIVAMTAADLVKWVAWGRVVVHEIHGWNNQNTNLYIQLHQVAPKSDGTLAANTIPGFKSLLAQANNGFMYNFGTQGIELQELLVAISTTETNYTAVGASGGLDMTLDVDSQFMCDGTEVVVGALTSSVKTLQVWAEASGPLRLLRVDINNQAGKTIYVMVYATDTIDATKLVISACPTPNTFLTKLLYGDKNSGLIPFMQDSRYVSHYGCNINLSDTSIPGSQYSGAAATNIIAVYKPLASLV